MFSNLSLPVIGQVAIEDTFNQIGANLHQDSIICEKGMKLRVEIAMPSMVCTYQPAQHIWYNMLLSRLVTYYETKLLEKLESSYETYIHSHSKACRRNQRLLHNIKNRQVIYLNYDASIGELNQMSQFLDNLYKACNL